MFLNDRDKQEAFVELLRLGQGMDFDDRVLIKNKIDPSKLTRVQAMQMLKGVFKKWSLQPAHVLEQQVQAFQKKIQAAGFTVSSDIPQLTKEAFTVTVESDYFDMGYERVFKNIQLGMNEDSWEITDLQNSLVVQKVNEGESLTVHGYTGDKITASTDYYGGALGWTDKMIRYRKLSSIIQVAETFRNKYFTTKSEAHYLLLAAAVDAAYNNITAYNVSNDGQLQNDIKTINAAAHTLSNRCKDKGYGDTAQMPLVLYCNPGVEDRIEAAFRATTANIAGAGANGESITRRRIERIYTYNSNIPTARPILVLPYNKIQKAEGMAPTIYSQPQDILTLNYVQSVWGIYGAAIGDTDQFQGVSLA